MPQYPAVYLMTNSQSLIQLVQKTQHGFTDIQKAAEEVFASHNKVKTLQLAGKFLEG